MTSRNRNRTEQRRIFLKYGGHCAYCGCQLDPFDWHIDHVLPRKCGGSHDSKNLVAACVPCNTRKGDMTMDEFRRWFPVHIAQRIRDIAPRLQMAWWMTEEDKLGIEAQIFNIARQLDEQRVVFYMERVMKTD